MISNQKLFSVGDFDFRLQHLLVIGILALSVSISMVIRSTPASYGFELFEFDPFFNYRATDYLLTNGSDAYFNWIDEKSWHPYGRDVDNNSQVVLHFLSAELYQLFGFGLTLYEFTILLPLIFGSITSVVVFAFVRVLGGTTAGLLAALIFSISVPIISRGLIGWFKSEPLGLFLGFLAIYLFVSGIKFNKRKTSITKLLVAGFFLCMAISAWGGSLIFLFALTVYFFIVPFFKKDKNFLIWAIPIFSSTIIISSMIFQRTSNFILTFSENPGEEFVFTLGIGGFMIILPTVFVVLCEIIKKLSSPTKKIRNMLFLLGSIIISMIGILSSNIIGLPTFRYLNAVNPFLTTQDPLTDSVAEHMTVDMNLSFMFISVFLIFTLIGAWFVFSKKNFLKNDMRAFILVLCFITIYLSSAFVRLELYASIAVIILSSIGLSILFNKIYSENGKGFLKIIFSGVILTLFILPVSLPLDNNWTDWADFPPSIMNGGTANSFYNNEWKVSMEWLKNNTPENSVVAAWWDYGYWITALSDRTTLIDNATVGDFQIKKVAYALTTEPEKSWHILNSDYLTDVSSSFGDETIIKFEGKPEKEFLLDYQSYLLLGTPGGPEIPYNTLEPNDKKLVDEYILNNGFTVCKPIFKAEAERLGIPEVTCNPVTKGLDADYVLTYVSGNRIKYTDEMDIYTLEGGGDESKKSWIVKISEQQNSKFIQGDGITPTKHFMENSALGKLIPFSIATYVEPNTDRAFDEYQNGLIPIYVKHLKYTNSETDPFYLVYASPSFYSKDEGPFHSILIYKINTSYEPKTLD